MDKTFLKLDQLYDEMLQELEDEMVALGGEVENFSPEEQIMHVVVEPSIQEYDEQFIGDLIIKYEKKRNRILQSDVFIGVKTILLENEDSN